LMKICPWSFANAFDRLLLFIDCLKILIVSGSALFFMQFWIPRRRVRACMTFIYDNHFAFIFFFLLLFSVYMLAWCLLAGLFVFVSLRYMFCTLMPIWLR
jgi:hypothetical protein